MTNIDFMEKAIQISQLSPDPNTKVGAIIVKDYKCISSGYNRYPYDYDPKEIIWERTGCELKTKYPYIVHAETNCIINAFVFNNINNLSNCIMYVTLFPCNECTKLIVQSGIKKVYYLEDKYADQNFTIAAKKIFDNTGIKYEQVFMEENISE